MGGDDFVEPGGFGGLSFAGEDLDDVAVFELGVEIDEFAVDFDAGDVATDFGVKAVGEVERKGAVGEVDNVALGGVDEDFVGEEVEFELFKVDLFAFAEGGGGGLDLGNPEEVGGEVLDFAGAIVFGEFLFVIVEAGGKAAFGIFMHFVGANLEFDNLFFGCDDGSMERLIAVLFGHSDVIFDATAHGGVEGVNNAESEVAGGDVVNDDAESGEVVDFGDVLVVFGEFFVEGVDGFNATVHIEVDFFGGEVVGNFFFDFAEVLFGRFIAFVDEVFEVVVAGGIDIGEGDVGHFDAEATHV